MVTEREAAQAVERLINYGLEKGLLDDFDWVAARNSLLDRLEISEPFSEQFVPGSSQENLRDILDQLLDYAGKQELLPKNTVTHRDLFDTEMMGFLMPRQSDVAERFWQTADNESIVKATDEFYQLAQDSNYIRNERIARNSYWRTNTDYGELEITINLAKPEKDPEEIAEAGSKEDVNYPRCPLCLENLGYPGRLDHPARQNLRVIPLELKQEDWFLQYSPYVYYQEHCIVLAREHRPMQINKDTFQRLLEFLEIFPHYFIGSNADLPLVGGSILSHDHFQGGNHLFPMEKANIREKYYHSDFPEVKVGLVDWPLSVIRLSSAGKEDLIELAEELRLSWEKYSDPARKIKAYSQDNGNEVRHNTVTPIARYRDDIFELDLVLRNNRCSEEHPAGIFHPHRKLHHIKKENIGLIEVMGLAVLPGRLKAELDELMKFLTGDRDPERGFEEYSVAQNIDLKKHQYWLEELLNNYGQQNSFKRAEKIIKKEVGNKFTQVLCDAGVFKNDSQGKEGFKEFMKTANFKEID